MFLKGLSLFSGAGIAETYFEQNGVHICIAVELLKERADIYRHLYPHVQMCQGDITDKGFFSDVLLKAESEGVDFIIATPPCQGMSTAGKKLYDDPRNKLIVYAIEAIKKIKPRFAIIENVPEILHTKINIHGEWVLIDNYIQAELGTQYVFNKNKLVNAMNYGVAQSRERCIYLLSRKDENISWEFPVPSKNILTMRDVIGDLPSLDPEVTDISAEDFHKLFPNFEQKKQAGLVVSPWHCPPKQKYRHVIAMMHTPEGNSAWNNEIYYPTLVDGTKSKGYKNTYKRQWWDKPAYTITKYTSRLGSQENGHPGRVIVDSSDEKKRLWSDPRVMTVFELMRLMSLPDDWGIPISTSSNVIREILGEGIPPRMIEKALIALDEQLTGRFRHSVNALSMFSNVGIAETYLSDVGVNVVIANELVEERVRFYSHLYPQVNVVCGDISKHEIFDKVIELAKKKDVQFLIATPPCQGMSCAGKKDPDDARNYLIYYAVEAVKAIKPKFVMLENVPMQQHTLISYHGEKVTIPRYVESELCRYYNFNSTRIVNAADYGIPQSRQRYFYLLVKKDEKVSWDFPKKEDKIVTLKDAIGWLPSLDPCVREEGEKWRFPDYVQKKRNGLLVSKWHYPPTHSWKQIEWMMHTPSAKSAFENEHFFPKKDERKIKGAPRTYMRMDWNKPATTIMQNSGVISAFSTVHPGRVILSGESDLDRLYSDARTLTIYELMILSSLPDDWNIPEWANDTLIRRVIGEGIPPLLVKKFVSELVRKGHYYER